MNVLELLNKSVEELESKGIIIDGFVDKTSDFQDISLFFERIKEHSNLLSDDLRNDLYSSYIDYVNKAQGKNQAIYSDSDNMVTKETGISTNDFISIEKKYKLEKSNEYNNKRTNKLSKVAIVATIVAVTVISTIAGPKILANYVNEPVKSTTTATAVQTTNEQSKNTESFDHTIGDQKEYIVMQYETKLGDNSENKIGKRLGIPGNEIRIISDYDMTEGRIIDLEIEDNQLNREIVDNYVYSNISISKEDKQKLQDYNFYVASGQDIKDVCEKAMEEYPILDEIYGGNSVKLANAIISQNPDKAQNYHIYQAGLYHFDLANSDSAKITQDMLDRHGIILNDKTY